MLADRMAAALEDLDRRHLLRRPRIIERVRGPYVMIEGREYLGFCSNDYLGLGQDPRLVEAANRAAREYGWGPASARLLSGTTPWHAALERALAEFKHTEAALAFPTGYMANLGLITSISDAETVILSDEMNHASLIDGCRLSKARVVKYPHRDVAFVERELKSCPERTKIVLTDTVFSMDGDRAPLEDLVRIAKANGADVVVDDAHGTGVFGADGRGVLEHLHLESEVPLHSATLSKAAGGLGGFVAGSRLAVEFLRSRARSFIFTTSPPPALCAASIEALHLMRESIGLRQKLWDNVNFLSTQLRGRGFDLRDSNSPIASIIIGSNERALAAAERLWEQGFFVPAIRPPSVPEGQARLRISLTALHDASHLSALMDALAKI